MFMSSILAERGFSRKVIVDNAAPLCASGHGPTLHARSDNVLDLCSEVSNWAHELLNRFLLLRVLLCCTRSFCDSETGSFSSSVHEDCMSI